MYWTLYLYELNVYNRIKKRKQKMDSNNYVCEYLFSEVVSIEVVSSPPHL